ncbi:MAG: dTDP-4-dehydrorhamnose 3,5-epimerase [Ginsengibacter sp.]
MEFIASNIIGLYTIQLKKNEDERGLFARTYCKNEFAQIGFDKEFVQFNHSLTRNKGTLRGIHFQKAPFKEYKLIRCIKGRVFDVAVDLRKNSSTFLKHIGVELNEENMLSILIPEGFGHAFQALSNDATLIYHHTNFYEPKAEGGIKYDDPVLNINWPLPVIEVSEKDKAHTWLPENFKGI